jgi:hypothetical protein
MITASRLAVLGYAVVLTAVLGWDLRRPTATAEPAYRAAPAPANSAVELRQVAQGMIIR